MQLPRTIKGVRAMGSIRVLIGFWCRKERSDDSERRRKASQRWSLGRLMTIALVLLAASATYILEPVLAADCCIIYDFTFLDECVPIPIYDCDGNYIGICLTNAYADARDVGPTNGVCRPGSIPKNRGEKYDKRIFIDDKDECGVPCLLPTCPLDPEDNFLAPPGWKVAERGTC